MKQLFRVFIMLLIPGMFISCDTDFDVRADYKEVAIIYGLLNQNDSIHYLRINKAFLGDGDALVYAQNEDSSSFGAEIEVVLTEKQPSGLTKEIVFDTISLYNKEEGTFYSPGQLFYYSTENLNQDNTYILTVKNKQTGYEASSQTVLIKDFNFIKPSSGAKNIGFKRSTTQKMEFSWKNAENARRYQLKLFFNYKELGIEGDTVHRRLEWIFPEVITDETVAQGESSIPYVNEEFFTLCETKIPYTDTEKENAVITRFASVCELELWVIGDEFSTYLDANGPTTGVLMERPDYTNITNGLGLFSCSYKKRRTPSLPLNAETILNLNTTTNLKFAKPN